MLIDRVLAFVAGVLLGTLVAQAIARLQVWLFIRRLHRRRISCACVACRDLKR